MVRLAIRPIVLGKRIELIRTDDPYLKQGDRGTVVDVSELPYEDKPFKKELIVNFNQNCAKDH